MSDLPGMPSTIRCEACGFENSTTSLYCQDCGQRLTAPAAPVAPTAVSEKVTPTNAPSAPPKTKPRILTANRTNQGASLSVIAIRTLVLAALATLAIQILRPPAGLPPAATPLAAPVVTNVRAALQLSAGRRAPFDAPWQSLNAYLAAVLQPSTPSGPLRAAFVRALLAPSNGGFSLFVQRKVAGLTLYTKVDYQFISRGNGIGITSAGAAVGRIPLPAWMAPLIESLNGGLDQALASELETLREAGSVTISRQKASINFGETPP